MRVLFALHGFAMPIVRGLLLPLRLLLRGLLLAAVVACSAFVFACVALTHWVDPGHRS